MPDDRLRQGALRAARRMRDRFGQLVVYERGDSELSLAAWPHMDRPTVDSARGSSAGRIDADAKEWCFLAEDLTDASECLIRPEEGDRIVTDERDGDVWELRKAVGGPASRYADATECVWVVFCRRV
jgi:hypothetical protein